MTFGYEEPCYSSGSVTAATSPMRTASDDRIRVARETFRRWQAAPAGGKNGDVTIAQRYEETIPVPRAIRFPVELIPPEGFDPERLETWPKVEGRLEYVNGRLLYMPPCGDMQQDTVADVVGVLLQWVRAHPGFVVSTNEAGMLLHGGARGADAAIWRRS